MDATDLKILRTNNFLRELRERYGDSPSKFEAATGYGANMVSQIKTGKKWINDKLARKLEPLMKLAPLSLDQEPPGTQRQQPRPAAKWPLSVPLEDYESLSPRAQREIDEAFTRMVLGAQSQDLLDKQAKRKRG